jgi:nitric oxide reductase activation protein
VLLIIDGESSDIDVHDPQYLVFDARIPVEENHRRGIYTYCMSRDPKADRCVFRIFGIRNWTVVDNIRRLPEKLPYLYVRLAR